MTGLLSGAEMMRAWSSQDQSSGGAQWQLGRVQVVPRLLCHDQLVLRLPKHHCLPLAATLRKENIGFRQKKHITCLSSS